jgi:hypothetical protein
MAARSPSLKVASPCPLRWDQLAGNDRVRFCGHCRQHVYNVSSLTMDQAVALIERCEGRVCMRLQRRADGTVITRDCLYLVRRARERIAASVLGVAVAAAGFWRGLGALQGLVDRWNTPAAACPAPPPTPRREVEPGIPEWLRSGYAPQTGPLPERRMGARKPKPAAPPPAPILRPKREPLLDDLGLMILKE